MLSSRDNLRAAADLQEWQFPSNTPLIGRLLSALRRAVFSIASKWALLSIVQQQTAFNNGILDAVERLQDTERLWRDVEASVLQLRRELAEEQQRARRERQSFESERQNFQSERQSFQSERVERLARDGEMRLRVESLERDVEDAITALLNLAAERREIDSPGPPPRLAPEPGLPANGAVKLDYFLFEMRYRGSTKEIAKRHEKYLPYFQTRQMVLDLGCGRGEFLELLIQNGVPARGVDLDDDMVDYCQQRGLPVDLSDAITFLEGFEDNSIGGIFMGQVVEHLPPDILIRLIQIAHQKLVPDAYFVAETINPMCLLALTTHYLMDWSHIHPVHPETLRFVLQSAGFDTPTVLYAEPVPDAVRLKRFSGAEEMSPAEREWLPILNENVDRLNDFLYGNQDYSVVARKIAWPKRLASVAARRALIATP